MGMSVSVSASIILIGAILILGLMYPALQVSDRKVNEAKQEWLTDQLKKQRSNMDVLDCSYNDTSERLNLSVKNSGSTTLHLNTIDILVNGTYRTDKINLSSTSVEGNDGTNLWMAGTFLNLTLDDIDISKPFRVKIVNEYGECAYHKCSKS